MKWRYGILILLNVLPHMIFVRFYAFEMVQYPHLSFIIDYLKSIYLLFIVDYVLHLFQFGPLPQLHFMLKEICWPLLQVIRYQLWTSARSIFSFCFLCFVNQHTFSIIIIIIISLHSNCSSCVFLSFTYGNTIDMRRIQHLLWLYWEHAALSVLCISIPMALPFCLLRRSV